MFFSVVDVVEPLPEQLDTPHSDYWNVLIIMYKKAFSLQQFERN